MSASPCRLAVGQQALALVILDLAAVLDGQGLESGLLEPAAGQNQHAVRARRRRSRRRPGIMAATTVWMSCSMLTPVFCWNSSRSLVSGSSFRNRSRKLEFITS